MSDVDRERVTANGLTFECLRQGDGDRLALCLHGFPDDAGSMRPLLSRFADAGFTAVAPYMRGYGPTDPAPDGDYTTMAMAKDAIALVEELDGEDPVLVGHDWGAAGAYAAAAVAPEQFSQLVTLAVPPRFVDIVPEYPRQWLRSWYIFFFQLPRAPERVLRARDFALVEWLWRTWSPTWDYPDERIEAVKETFRQPGTVEAALTYYRQFGRQAAEKLVDDAIERRFAGERDEHTIEVPTLLLAGKADGCMGHELFDDAEEAFAGRCRCLKVRGAGHFLHQERPDVVADEILSFVTEG